MRIAVVSEKVMLYGVFYRKLVYRTNRGMVSFEPFEHSLQLTNIKCIKMFHRIAKWRSKYVKLLSQLLKAMTSGYH